MSRKQKATWTMNFLFSLSLQSLVLGSGPNITKEPQNQRETSHPPEQEIKVTVLVHNYARLPRQILSDAKDRASLIFRKAGVEVLRHIQSAQRLWMQLSFSFAFFRRRQQRPRIVVRLSWPLASPISFGIESRNEPKD